MRLRAPIFFALSVLSLACDPGGAETTHVDASSQAILAGKKDVTHKSVLGIVYNNGPASEFCTGYLVTPDLVLTARHCVLALERPNGGCVGENRTMAGDLFALEKMLVFTEDNPSGPEDGKPVAEILTPEDPTLCGNDLALLRLVEPATTLQPIALRIDGPPVVDEALTVVGYGATKGGEDTTSGTRRSRSGVTVSSVGESPRAIEGEWTISEGPCVGDSGGPALDVSGISIGVMSRGDQETCKGMVYERLDTHAEWLRAAAKDSATRLGGPIVAWADAAAPGAGGAGGSSDGQAGASGAEAGGSSGEPGPSAAPAAGADDGGCTVAAAPVPAVPGGFSILAAMAVTALGLVRRNNARSAARARR